MILFHPVAFLAAIGALILIDRENGMPLFASKSHGCSQFLRAATLIRSDVGSSDSLGIGCSQDALCQVIAVFMIVVPSLVGCAVLFWVCGCPSRSGESLTFSIIGVLSAKMTAVAGIAKVLCVNFFLATAFATYDDSGHNKTAFNRLRALTHVAGERRRMLSIAQSGAL